MLESFAMALHYHIWGTVLPVGCCVSGLVNRHESARCDGVEVVKKYDVHLGYSSLDSVPASKELCVASSAALTSS
jgi:hypothetical protein